MAVHRCSPFNLMELERSCKEEWEKLLKHRCAKLVASYSKTQKLEAVIFSLFILFIFSMGLRGFQGNFFMLSLWGID